jgi:hypothetical protein
MEPSVRSVRSIALERADQTVRTGRGSAQFYNRFFGADIMARDGVFLDAGAGDSPYGATRVNVVRLDPNYRLEPPDIGCNCVSGVCEALPFRSGVFSTVLACFVVQHTADVSQSLSELFRVCAPHGIIAIVPVWRPSRLPAYAGGIHARYVRVRHVHSFMYSLIIHRPHEADLKAVADALAASGALIPSRLVERGTRMAMRVLIRYRGTTRISVIRQLPGFLSSRPARMGEQG